MPIHFVIFLLLSMNKMLGREREIAALRSHIIFWGSGPVSKWKNRCGVGSSLELNKRMIQF
jgi:hypothetical protein